MSRTYRRHCRGGKTTQGKLNAQYAALNRKFNTSRRSGICLSIWAEWRKAYREIGWIRHSYSKNPSHWNHDFGTVPRRAKERNLCRKIMQGYIDPDEAVFPHASKGVPYYW